MRRAREDGIIEISRESELEVAQMRVEAKLEELGLALPEPAKLPPGVQASFAWVRAYGDRVYVSGHGPLAPDGTPSGPFGKVGEDVSPEQGYEAARSTALAILSSLKRELGDLDRVRAWLMVHGMVNAAPGFAQTTNVINGFSDLIVELYGPEAGTHGAGVGGATAEVTGRDRSGGSYRYLANLATVPSKPSHEKVRDP
jgi:enamine deaminase RidA (YjgF/YER057c/UK114 family)